MIDGAADNRRRQADRLRQCGIAPTHQRIEIACVLFEAGGHFTAEEVFSVLNQQQAGVSRATVYNTLNLFAERGLVKQLELGRGCIQYDTNMAPHHHVVNYADMTLVDIPAEAVRVLGLPELPLGTTLEGIEVVVRVHRDTRR